MLETVHYITSFQCNINSANLKPDFCHICCHVVLTSCWLVWMKSRIGKWFSNTQICRSTNWYVCERTNCSSFDRFLGPVHCSVILSLTHVFFSIIAAIESVDLCEGNNIFLAWVFPSPFIFIPLMDIKCQKLLKNLQNVIVNWSLLNQSVTE